MDILFTSNNNIFVMLLTSIFYIFIQKYKDINIIIKNEFVARIFIFNKTV
jgi:hypothetical protein